MKGDQTLKRYLELMGLAAEGGKSERIGLCIPYAFGHMSIYVAASATPENNSS